MSPLFNSCAEQQVCQGEVTSLAVQYGAINESECPGRGVEDPSEQNTSELAQGSWSAEVESGDCIHVRVVGWHGV